MNNYKKISNKITHSHKFKQSCTQTMRRKAKTHQKMAVVFAVKYLSTICLSTFETSAPKCFSLNIILLLSFSHSYSGRVVGNGLHAQRQNPEVKVRSPNPTLAEVKERLERFNQVRCTIVRIYAHICLCFSV